ncbi:hypothetical protein ANN_24038 [Periplaneta americana]|uniref:Uncharacterized protein n=1 Tax=Periplaneta americana TaxID=6978 RepID=A0ABQ8S1Z6_PERAM|nr:hypothetical protein ANN_24038 [Periplaneta americana]
MAGLCEGGNEPLGSLKAICKLRVLTSSLQERNEEISDLRSKLSILEKDFRYNLQLLKCKDEALLEMERILQQLQNKLDNKTEEISTLKVELTDMKKRERDMIEEEASARQELQLNITRKNTEMEEMKRYVTVSVKAIDNLR